MRHKVYKSYHYSPGNGLYLQCEYCGILLGKTTDYVTEEKSAVNTIVISQTERRYRMTNHRWRWRPIIRQIREASPDDLLQFEVDLADAEKLRSATWRVSKELKTKHINLEISIDKLTLVTQGKAIFYAHLHQVWVEPRWFHLVTMYRYGDHERHSYVLCLRDTYGEALQQAVAEETRRGGHKYKAEIIKLSPDIHEAMSVIRAATSSQWAMYTTEKGK